MSEQNDNPTDSQSSSSTKSVLEKCKDWCKDGSDIIGKLSAAIAAILGFFVVNNIQDKLSAANLLSQREQAETQLRATMFSNLMDRIVTKDQQKPETGKMLLLAELLALNFDEHFQFKPLLINLQKELKGQQDQQLELKAVARRIVDRQTDLLRATVTTQGDEYQQGHGKIQDIFTSDLFFKKSNKFPISYGCNFIDASSFGSLDISALKNITNEGWVNTQQQPAYFTNQGPSQCITVVSPEAKTSPDSAYLLDIAVLEYEPKEKTVTVSVNVTGTKLRSTSVVYEFEVTPFDFPLTDNTAIDSDHRFAIVQEEVDEDKIWLRLIWFPKGYITERERPINYSEMRGLLKAKKEK